MRNFFVGAAAVLQAAVAFAVPAGPFWVCTTNEASGTVTIIDGPTRQVVGTIAVGKRPRGIHASPDGRLLYVAPSGNPIGGPTQLDAQGRPIEETPDPGAVDPTATASRSSTWRRGRWSATCPRARTRRSSRWTLRPRLVVSNEDVGTISLVGIGTGEVLDIARVGGEPEGVRFSPDGGGVYATCETDGMVFVAGPLGPAAARRMAARRPAANGHADARRDPRVRALGDDRRGAGCGCGDGRSAADGHAARRWRGRWGP